MNIDLSEKSGVWVYGSGTFARQTVTKLNSLGVSVLGVIDHHNVGQIYIINERAFRVYSLPDIELLDNSTVVLAVCNLFGNLHEIASKIKRKNRSIRLISPVELFQFYKDMQVHTNNYWLTTEFELYEKDNAQIDAFRQSLADNVSRTLYDSIINYRKCGDLDLLPNPSPISSQYLADDLLTPPMELRVIDLGACQGENLEYFLNSGRKFLGGYLFEPDAHNVKILKEKLRSLGLNSLEVVQAGAWNFSGKLKFDSTGNPAASVIDSGGTEISVVALDEFLSKDGDFNFVKMDIEGAEMNALLGMREFIKNNALHLAISVYHKPADLWEIGNFLNVTYPNKYKYFLRMYGHQTFDTILYAVPNLD